jgi:hypothetical protein
MILDATVAKVRQRASEGDCPITAAYSVEHLETALLTLADSTTQPDTGGAVEASGAERERLIVPREPTEAMLRRGGQELAMTRQRPMQTVEEDARDCWQAMVGTGRYTYVDDPDVRPQPTAPAGEGESDLCKAEKAIMAQPGVKLAIAHGTINVRQIARAVLAALRTTPAPALSVDLGELKRLAEAAAKRAPGLWGSDIEKGEGSYGEGDEDRTGFMVPYMETEHGKRLFDAHYCDVAEVHEDYDSDDDGVCSIYAWDQAAKELFDFLAAVQPQTVLSLIAQIERMGEGK